MRLAEGSSDPRFILFFANTVPQVTEYPHCGMYGTSDVHH